MNHHDHPIINLMMVFDDEDRAFHALMPKAIRITSVYKDSSRELARRRMRMVAKRRLARVRALADRLTETLARFELLLPSAPRDWQATMYELILDRSDQIALARSSITVLRGVIEPPERLPLAAPRFRLN